MLVALLSVSQAGAVETAVSLRYRHGWLPGGTLDIWYFDEDDEGAIGDRPNVQADVFGLEVQVSPQVTGSAFQFWVERMPIRMDPGYWDDVESPPEHEDGDWLEPNPGFGLWTLGANAGYVLAFTDEAKPVWVGLSAGGGLGIGIASGSVTRWYPGEHDEVVEPNCGPGETAIERATHCVDDGEVDLPAVIPMLDVTVGPMVSLYEHARVRLDVGLHTVPYVGVTAGGAF